MSRRTGRCRHCSQPISEYLPELWEDKSGSMRCDDGSLLGEYHEPFAAKDVIEGVSS